MDVQVEELLLVFTQEYLVVTVLLPYVQIGQLYQSADVPMLCCYPLRHLGFMQFEFCDNVILNIVLFVLLFVNFLLEIREK